MRSAVLAGAVTLGLAGSAFQPAAAQAFQGTIHFTIHDQNGRTTEVTQLSKPGKTSFMGAEQGKAGGGMIIDSSAGTMTFVDGETKSYTVINLALLQQMENMTKGMMNQSRGSDASNDHGSKGTITPTGRSEVVAGVTCQVYAFDGTNDGRHETGEVCLAKGAGLMVGGALASMPGMMGMRERQMMQTRLQGWGPLGTMLSQGYGILKGTSFENGKPSGSLEVTALQRGAPPDASFQPPAGFTEKSMPEMMGGRHP